MPTIATTAPTGAASRHVHRRLRKGDSGPDVKQMQHGIDHKAATWKLPQFAVDVDGVHGVHTHAAARHLLFAIGATGPTMKAARKGVITEQGQRLLRGTEARTPAMKRAAARRRGKVRSWRKKGLGLAAYDVAESLIGVMEEGGNNTGKKVDQIIRSNGGYVGEPWCGDFVAYCYRLAGSTSITRSWASVSALRWVVGIVRTTAPKLGDLVRFTFDHVGMFVRFLGNGEIETIEGNTGPTGAVSDSSTGGDGVYRKRRSISLVNDYLHVTR
jgi:hypothetical protein